MVARYVFVCIDENILSVSTKTQESAETFEAMFPRQGEQLECKTEVTAFLKDIAGL